MVNTEKKPRKTRSNKGVKRGPRPATLAKLAERERELKNNALQATLAFQKILNKKSKARPVTYVRGEKKIVREEKMRERELNKQALKATRMFQRILNKKRAPPTAASLEARSEKKRQQLQLKAEKKLQREAEKDAERATRKFQRMLNRKVAPPKASAAYKRGMKKLQREANKDAEKATRKFQRILNKKVAPPKADVAYARGLRKLEREYNENAMKATRMFQRVLNKKVAPPKPRKTRSNKGMKRGPRPATLEKLEKKARNDAERESKRLEEVLKLIAKRRSLTNDQKSQALINRAAMSAKNLRAKYIIVQKRAKEAAAANKAAAPKKTAAANKAKKLVNNIPNYMKVAEGSRRRRSKVNNLN